jgi:hypothetical protein
LSGFAAAAADVDLGTSFKLINVLDPLAQDAATKNYVDTQLNSSNVLANKMYLWETLMVLHSSSIIWNVAITKLQCSNY